MNFDNKRKKGEAKETLRNLFSTPSLRAWKSPKKPRVIYKIKWVVILQLVEEYKNYPTPDRTSERSERVTFWHEIKLLWKEKNHGMNYDVLSLRLGYEY